MAAAAKKKVMSREELAAAIAAMPPPDGSSLQMPTEGDPGISGIKQDVAPPSTVVPFSPLGIGGALPAGIGSAPEGVAALPSNVPPVAAQPAAVPAPVQAPPKIPATGGLSAEKSSETKLGESALKEVDVDPAKLLTDTAKNVLPPAAQATGTSAEPEDTGTIGKLSKALNSQPLILAAMFGIGALGGAQSGMPPGMAMLRGMGLMGASMRAQSDRVERERKLTTEEETAAAGTTRAAAEKQVSETGAAAQVATAKKWDFDNALETQKLAVQKAEGTDKFNIEKAHLATMQTVAQIRAAAYAMRAANAMEPKAAASADKAVADDVSLIGADGETRAIAWQKQYELAMKSMRPGGTEVAGPTQPGTVPIGTKMGVFTDKSGKRWKAQVGADGKAVPGTITAAE